MSSSQCVILNSLRPRLWNEAATREPTLIEQRHEDGDPALAKDTDQAELGCGPWPGGRTVIIRQRQQRTHWQCVLSHTPNTEQPQRRHRHG